MEQPKNEPALKQRIDKLSLKTQMCIVVDMNEFLKREIALYEKLEEITQQCGKKKLMRQRA